MKRELASVVAVTALLSPFSLASLAIADPSPTPSPTSSPLSPVEQYRIDRENYFNAMKTITNNFKAACDLANSNYESALAIAKTKDQKRAARIARESAITAATIEFESAKSALGPMPIEPLRAAKAPGKSKAKQR